MIWVGYDQLYTHKLSHVQLAEADLQLERSVTALLHDEIQAILSRDHGGYPSYILCHERWEFETMDPASNRPPQYDLAFVWLENPLVLWPCEVKVLRTDKSVADYVRDVTKAFLPCIYAPFSSSGAMLGLLCSGMPGDALTNISTALSVAFSIPNDFSARPHRISSHVRSVPASKSYPADFVCNHLILSLC